MRYCGGMIRRARSSEMGMTATVPFKTPVALLGYSAAIGFGWSYVWHTSGMTSIGWEKYDELAYRSASTDKKLTRKYCSFESCVCIFDRDIVRNATTGWHKSARSRQVLNIFLESLELDESD